MSILDRFVRALDTFSNIELDGQSRGGMRGEQYAEWVLVEGQNETYIHSPLLPHPRKPGVFFETDFLVFTHGTLFCVEIKNFRGKVYYPALYRTVSVTKGWLFFKRNVPTQVFDRYDDTKMIQQKPGPRGMETRTMPNPLYKTRDYAQDLNMFLTRINKRLKDVPIIPVLAFAGRADISQIYNFSGGIILTNELPAFFAHHNHQQQTQHLSNEIKDALRRIPTWDLILTTQGEVINGILQGKTFDFRDTQGRTHRLPYASIAQITFQRSGVLSAFDELTVSMIDGSSKHFQSVSGELHLERFGDHQTHKLRNINRLIVGIANRGF